jgi:hypothetical protein
MKTIINILPLSLNPLYNGNGRGVQTLRKKCSDINTI